MTSYANLAIKDRSVAMCTCAFWPERCGVALTTLEEAAREIAQSVDAEP